MLDRVSEFEEIIKYRKWLEEHHNFFGPHHLSFNLSGISIDVDHDLYKFSWDSYSPCCGIETEELYILVDAFEHEDYDETFRREYRHPNDFIRIRDGERRAESKVKYYGGELQKEYRERKSNVPSL
jgi:hypothetical protein